MKKSIFLKIFSGYFIIILIFSLLISVFSIQEIKKSYLNTITDNLVDFANSQIFMLQPLIENNENDSLNIIIKKLDKETGIRITIINLEGNVIADSKKDANLMENHKNRPEVQHAIMYGLGQSLRYSTTVKEEMLYIALPVYSENKIICVLRVSLFLKDINALLDNLKHKIISFIIIVMLISLILAYIFTKNLSNPIKELVKVSKKIAKGDFNTSIILNREDELKELADSFNYMSNQLSVLFKELKIKQEELEKIMTSLEGGLFVVENNSKISIYNESFEKIINKKNIEDKFYWEIIKNEKINNIIEYSLKNKKNICEEIELNEKYFICCSNCMHREDKIIIVLHEITKFKKLEKMKKDFIMNVSHELRTPLTAIKGYLETLEDEVKGEEKKYLHIIKKHTERLINIVKDLMILSSLENVNNQLDVKTIDLLELCNNVFPIFYKKVEEKKLTLELLYDKKEKYLIKGDVFKLEQMLVNLIDNAIKYTERGKISIILQRQEKFVSITVEDTGIGIEKKHLERIFERFYVVNKSRSRQFGGTGLGLSIVKHIVLLHNGKINIESFIDQGTKITVSFPLD